MDLATRPAFAFSAVALATENKAMRATVITRTTRDDWRDHTAAELSRAVANIESELYQLALAKEVASVERHVEHEPPVTLSAPLTRGKSSMVSPILPLASAIGLIQMPSATWEGELSATRALFARGWSAPVTALYAHITTSDVLQHRPFKSRSSPSLHLRWPPRTAGSVQRIVCGSEDALGGRENIAEGT
jgi:hypothetical protein